MSTPLTHNELIAIAEEYGTPLYVYHADKIKEQYAKLQNAFENTNTVFFYACKALTNINVLRYIRNLGANVDCSSINEVKLAMHAGFPSSRILYTSNGIDFNEINRAFSVRSREFFVANIKSENNLVLSGVLGQDSSIFSMNEISKIVEESGNES